MNELTSLICAHSKEQGRETLVKAARTFSCLDFFLGFFLFYFFHYSFLIPIKSKIRFFLSFFILSFFCFCSYFVLFSFFCFLSIRILFQLFYSFGHKSPKEISLLIKINGSQWRPTKYDQIKSGTEKSKRTTKRKGEKEKEKEIQRKFYTRIKETKEKKDYFKYGV